MTVISRRSDPPVQGNHQSQENGMKKSAHYIGSALCAAVFISAVYAGDNANHDQGWSRYRAPPLVYDDENTGARYPEPTFHRSISCRSFDRCPIRSDSSTRVVMNPIAIRASRVGSVGATRSRHRSRSTRSDLNRIVLTVRSPRTMFRQRPKAPKAC